MKMIGRKGSVADILVWLVIGFFASIFFAGIIYMFLSLGNALSGIGMMGSVNVTEVAQDTFGQAQGSVAITLQRIALIIMIGGAISIFIHNFLIKEVSGAFFITYILFSLMAVVISAYLSNYYMELLSNPVLGSILQEFTGYNFIMQWLPYFSTVVGIVGLIFLVLGSVYRQEATV